MSTPTIASVEPSATSTSRLRNVVLTSCWDPCRLGTGSQPDSLEIWNACQLTSHGRTSSRRSSFARCRSASRRPSRARAVPSMSSLLPLNELWVISLTLINPLQLLLSFEVAVEAVVGASRGLHLLLLLLAEAIHHNNKTICVGTTAAGVTPLDRANPHARNTQGPPLKSLLLNVRTPLPSRKTAKSVALRGRFPCQPISPWPGA